MKTQLSMALPLAVAAAACAPGDVLPLVSTSEPVPDRVIVTPLAPPEDGVPLPNVPTRPFPGFTEEAQEGAGGSTSSGGDAVDPDSSSATGGGADPLLCTVDTDCPAPELPCRVARCESGVCMSPALPEGTILPASHQNPGDCASLRCDAYGFAAGVVDLGDADDLNACTVDACSDGGASHQPVAAGALCANGTCGDTGVCHAPGAPVWKASVALGGASATVDCLALDSDDAAIVSGRLNLSSTQQSLAFVVKVSRHGGVRWVRDLGHHVDGAVRVVVTPNGRVVGSWRNTFAGTGGVGATLQALASDGSSLWERATEPGFHVVPGAFDLDPSGVVRAERSLLNGSCYDFGGGPVCEDGVARYDLEGQFLGFEVGAVVAGACSPSAVTSWGAVVTASTMGSMLTIDKLAP